MLTQSHNSLASVLAVTEAIQFLVQTPDFVAKFFDASHHDMHRVFVMLLLFAHPRFVDLSFRCFCSLSNMVGNVMKSRLMEVVNRDSHALKSMNHFIVWVVSVIVMFVFVMPVVLVVPLVVVPLVVVTLVVVTLVVFPFMTVSGFLATTHFFLMLLLGSTIPVHSGSILSAILSTTLIVGHEFTDHILQRSCLLTQFLDSVLSTLATR